MLNIITLLIGIFSISAVHAQAKPPLALEEYYEGIYKQITPKEEIRLFDLNEIYARKIDSVYIIRHPASWEENWPNQCSFNDTLDFYRFDSKGRIIQWTYFQGLGDYSTTFHLDSIGNTISRVMYSRSGSNPGTKTYPTPPPDTANYKYITKREKTGNDSVLTEFSLWRFKTGFDTAYIVTRVYNKKGKLIEIKSTSNNKYQRELFDDTGELKYHYKYDYDDDGRLIYYQALGAGYYEKISYPFYGKLTELFDAQTNIIKTKSVRLINEDEGVITISTDELQVVLTPLAKGSKLYKLKTKISLGEFPTVEYYEINYK